MLFLDKMPHLPHKKDACGAVKNIQEGQIWNTSQIDQGKKYGKETAFHEDIR